MRTRPLLSLLAALTVTLSGSLASMSAAGANEGSAETQPRVLPAAAPVVAGTPLEILNETPVTEGLVSGFESGMFIPKGSFNEKDSKGCLYKKQLFIAMAVKKPSIGPGCTLTGGEWLADFGTKRITDAKDIDLGQLLPDKFVYAQGARNWTEQQRRQYGQWDGSGVVTPRMTMNGLIETSNLQIMSNKSAKFLQILNNTIDQGVIKDQDQFEAQLQALRQLNPGLFDSWSVATLLNVKQWGLSFNPGTAADFQVSIRECSNKTTTIINGTNIILKNPGKMARPVSQIQSMPNPCSNTYSVPNLAAKFNIVPVPLSASATPGTDNQVLSGYGTPQGPAISRFLFGMHAPAHWTSDRASGYDGPIEQSSIPTVPVGSTRLWDTETAWADIEPEKGQFVYSKLQKQIEMAQRLDARPMLVLGGTPAWAGSGGRNSVPNSVEDYKNYVRAVACHFGESIFAYEVWNEANIKDFWAGNATQMADLTMAAFEAIRGCNPNALVVAASTTTRATGSFSTFYPAYLDELRRRNWPVDAYSVHSYPEASGDADARILGIGQFKTMLALAGAPKTTIFDTETNYGLAGLNQARVPYTGASARTLIARTYIDSARYGFDSTYWFVWTRGEDTKYGIQMNSNAWEERQAWNITFDWLVGAQFQRCFDTDKGITVCQFNRGAENFSIVWYGGLGTNPISTSAGYFSGLGSRACDLYGTCIPVTSSSALALGPMPTRIDGAPSGSGSVAGEETPDATEAPLPPYISPDPAIEYATANLVKASVVWMESPAGPSPVPVTGFDYELSFCPGKGGSCTKVIRKGSTGAGIQKQDFKLTEGPGNYELRVRAKNAAGASDWSRETINVKSTLALPPSNVVANFVDASDTVRLTWDAPNVAKSKIDFYEVEMTALDPRIPWGSLVFKTKATSLEKTLKELKLGPTSTFQFRVRTVLTGGNPVGAKSLFVFSNELTLSQSIPAREAINSTFYVGSRAVLVSPRPDLINPSIMGFSWQIRVSTDQGLSWIQVPNSALLRINGVAVPAGDVIPSNINAVFIDARALGVELTEAVRVQVRNTNADLTAASPWEMGDETISTFHPEGADLATFPADQRPQVVVSTLLRAGQIISYVGYNTAEVRRMTGLGK